MTLTGLGAREPGARDVAGPRGGAADPAAGRGRSGSRSAAVPVPDLQVGDRVRPPDRAERRREIREIYGLRELRPRGEIATRLAMIIGPAEELFWRGLVQQALMRRYGPWPGAALAAAAYGGVHVVTGNFTLLGAANMAGADWGALYARACRSARWS